MTTTTKKEKQTLAEKQAVMRGLVTVLELNKRLLSKEENLKIEMYEFNLTKDIQTLVDECKHKEMDLKIEAMQKTLAVVKNNTYNL